MSRLLRPINMFFIYLFSWSCACYPGVAGAHQRGSPSFGNRELVPATIQPYNPIGIDTRAFVSVTESIAGTPEPVSLALFGSGLTVVGVVLLRSSRRTKSSTSTRAAHSAVDHSCLRLACDTNGIQYPRPNVAAPERLVSTYVSSGAR